MQIIGTYWSSTRVISIFSSNIMVCNHSKVLGGKLCHPQSHMEIERSREKQPINLGSSELVSINQLVDIVEEIAKIKLKRSYNLKAPKGVAGRNSDNTLIKKLLNWEPSTRLRDGMEKTYAWINDQMMSKQPVGAH